MGRNHKTQQQQENTQAATTPAFVDNAAPALDAKAPLLPGGPSDDTIKNTAKRAVKKAELKGDDAHADLHAKKEHLEGHAEFGKRKAGELAEETRVGANEALHTASDKIDEWNQDAKAAGAHLKEHAQFGERKTGEIVDELKETTRKQQLREEQHAAGNAAIGHHNHAQFDSAAAHALYHVREGLEMARKIAIDAKSKIVGDSPVAGIEDGSKTADLSLQPSLETGLLELKQDPSDQPSLQPAVLEQKQQTLPSAQLPLA